MPYHNITISKISDKMYFHSRILYILPTLNTYIYKIMLQHQALWVCFVIVRTHESLHRSTFYTQPHRMGMWRNAGALSRNMFLLETGAFIRVHFIRSFASLELLWNNFSPRLTCSHQHASALYTIAAKLYVGHQFVSGRLYPRDKIWWHHRPFGCCNTSSCRLRAMDFHNPRWNEIFAISKKAFFLALSAQTDVSFSYDVIIKQKHHNYPAMTWANWPFGEQSEKWVWTRLAVH